MVADGEIGILIRVGEVVRAVSVVHTHYGRHEQSIDEAVGDASRVGRGVVHLRLRGGQSLLLGASVGGIHSPLQSWEQFPLQIGVEVISLETRVENDAVLIGVAG